MIDQNKIKPNNEKEDKKQIKPSDIQGKIEVPDLSERRDGPGGN